MKKIVKENLSLEHNIVNRETAQKQIAPVRHKANWHSQVMEFVRIGIHK